MGRDIRKLVATHEAFVDNGIKAGWFFRPAGPVYAVFILDLLTYVCLPCGRWYARHEDTPRGVRPCHLEKAYRSQFAGLVDRWVPYHELSDLFADPTMLPEVRRLLAVSV